MKIELAPIDYYFYRPNLYTIQFAFEYENKISLEKITDGVYHLLKRMPVVGSRIQRISDFKIVLKPGHEIPIREQEINSNTSDLPTQLFDTVSNVENEPLLKILISHMARGSYVGVSFSHMLGDGSAFFMFMQELSREISSKNSNFTANTDRSKLSTRVQNERTTLFEATGYVRPRPQNPNRVGTEHVFYSSVDLNQMKKSCNSSEIKVSTNDIIMADLAKRFHKSIPLFENQFIVRCPVDYRKIIGLDQNYFGNAVKDAVATFDSNELDKMSLQAVAKRIRDCIDRIDETAVDKSLTALDFFRRENGIDAFQELGCPGLLISNLSKFPISKIDLGSGSPCNFHHASLNPRLALILPVSNGLMVKFKRPIT